MEIRTLARRLSAAASLTALAALGACEASDPTAPVDDDATVVAGQVVPASPSSAPAGASSTDPSGIRVEVEGSAEFAVTDAEGRFRLEVPAGDGRIRLRLRRGDLDLRLEFEGPGAGNVLRIEIRLSAGGGSGEGTATTSEHEFEGVATLVSLDGAVGARSLKISVADVGGPVLVDILEASTAIGASGDLVSFEALVAAALLGTTFRVEGDGAFREDGSVLATHVKAEIDLGGDDGAGDGGASGSIEFKGTPTLAALTGAAPDRTLRVSVPHGGATLLVEIREAGTTIEADGDLTTFAAILGALNAGVSMEVEGRGTLDAEGVLVATIVKAETEG